MQNQAAAVSRRMSDPDFAAKALNSSLWLNVAMLAIIGLLAARDIYKSTHEPDPRYFRIDGVNPPQAMLARSSPIVDDTQLLQWSVKAILALYNINYHDYPEQLSVAGRRFTRQGWDSFAVAFRDTRNLEAMKAARLLCFAQTQRAAIIRDARVIDGALSYDVQVPIKQTCQNTRGETTKFYMMTALVTRTNDIESHPDGVAVQQLVAEDKSVTGTGD